MHLNERLDQLDLPHDQLGLNPETCQQRSTNEKKEQIQSEVVHPDKPELRRDLMDQMDQISLQERVHASGSMTHDSSVKWEQTIQKDQMKPSPCQHAADQVEQNIQQKQMASNVFHETSDQWEQNIQQEQRTSTLIHDTADQVEQNIQQERMKRFRFRGDWSDTGPLARPRVEREQDPQGE